ncbi:MAG: hypothetical protein IKZ60_01000 [Bacteroidales bacterium]|nr:hypothetical protein [Bacteroidales bacterium]
MKRVFVFLSTVLLVLSCGKIDGVKTVDLAKLSADYEAKDGDILTGILDGNYKITIADGATVTLKNAVVYGVDDRDCKWAGITLLGDATLVLEASNIVRGFDAGFPGILVPKGKTLTITGNGKLDASSNGCAPGIGGDDDNGGNIVILGGTIRATGGDGAAAIGSMRFRSCGDITISGGTVTAIGGDDGAGIGSGLEASCGNITISDGTVIAESVLSAAGIGCGHLATCGNISISGGDVTSRGGDDAAGIGSGSGEDDDEEDDEDEEDESDDVTSICGDITISGGTVTVHGHSIIAAAAIGSGCNARCGNILISGGTVTAEGGYKSAGIGTSERGSVGNITITSGVTQVTAKKWDEKTPHSIGGGVDYVSIGTVTIGGKVGPVSESPFVYKP